MHTRAKGSAYTLLSQARSPFFLPRRPICPRGAGPRRTLQPPKAFPANHLSPRPKCQPSPPPWSRPPGRPCRRRVPRCSAASDAGDQWHVVRDPPCATAATQAGPKRRLPTAPASLAPLPPRCNPSCALAAEQQLQHPSLLSWMGQTRRNGSRPTRLRRRTSVRGPCRRREVRRMKAGPRSVQLQLRPAGCARCALASWEGREPTRRGTREEARGGGSSRCACVSLLVTELQAGT